MISVEEALARVLDLAEPVEIEHVPLAEGSGRILAENLSAQRDQPPFPSSAMDGYAIHSADAVAGKTLEVIGESAAGNRFAGSVPKGKAVRIFTGAPVPEGADKILIQEDAKRNGTRITVDENFDHPAYIRPQGYDFKKGETLAAPLRLRPSDIALLASMNIPVLPVYRKPVVALISTGDELVVPGDQPGPDQIMTSNNYGLKALFENQGATVRLLPIARDNEASLKAVFSFCQGADLIVTLGGASVGDYDLVHKVASDTGLKSAFYKVAMRPGKPLMAGRYNRIAMLGLPGNPVSAMVCGQIFVVPVLRAMLGLGKQARRTELVPLGKDIGPNGPRSHYMRAHLTIKKGAPACTPFDRQDSSLLSVLAKANCLMLRAPNETAKTAGTLVPVIRI